MIVLRSISLLARESVFSFQFFNFFAPAPLASKTLVSRFPVTIGRPKYFLWKGTSLTPKISRILFFLWLSMFLLTINSRIVKINLLPLASSYKQRITFQCQSFPLTCTAEQNAIIDKKDMRHWWCRACKPKTMDLITCFGMIQKSRQSFCTKDKQVRRKWIPLSETSFLAKSVGRFTINND